MISLYESILGSTKSGKRALIEQWCIENKPFKNNWEILSNGEIKCTKQGYSLEITFEDYNELPDYIQFADDDNLTVSLGKGKYNTIKVFPKSLRGIPKKCKNLEILLNTNELPDLEITVNNLIVQTNVTKLNKFVIHFEGDSRTFRLRAFEIESFDEITLKGVKVINLVNDFNWGDKFSSAMNRKAEMNKYKGHYETPVTDRGLEVINSFFGKNIDMKDLEEIDYTQNSRVVKHNGKWYRCKNW